MRQTSEQFMDEMLKDNQPVVNKADDMLAGFQEKMANMIDERIEAALSQFKAEAEKVNVPDQEEKENKDETRQSYKDSTEDNTPVQEESAAE